MVEVPVCGDLGRHLFVKLDDGADGIFAVGPGSSDGLTVREVLVAE